MQNTQRHTAGALVAALMLFPAALFAAEPAGSRDHPLIQRYPGSEIAAYIRETKAVYPLPVGPLKDGKPDKTLTVNGTVTRITYHVPANAAAAEVYRFFASELAEAGFETLFAASGDQLSKGTDWADTFYRGDPAVSGETKNQHFISAKRSRPREMYVALYVGQGWYAYPVVQLDVVEKKTDAPKKAKTAGLLQRRIERSGYAVIPSLQFDEATDTIKAGSEQTLQEIAEAVAACPQRHFYVVGHLDNAGGFNASLERSQRRAEAVVRELVSRYGVPASQVTARGVGPLCPAGDTVSYEGRRANTRIELVAP